MKEVNRQEEKDDDAIRRNMEEGKKGKGGGNKIKSNYCKSYVYWTVHHLDS